MKNSSRWIPVTGILVMAMALVVCAADTKTPPGTRKPLLVHMVNAESHTITIKGGVRDELLEYTFDNFTRITVNGKSAAIGEVQPGMRVDVTVRSDGKLLSRIDAQDYTPPKTSTKK